MLRLRTCKKEGTIQIIKKKKGVIANMMKENFTVYDLDDLIYGDCTLIPSDR